ncbi:MAG: hypothetical protein ACREO8_09590 [Luteimonas sp.]
MNASRATHARRIDGVATLFSALAAALQWRLLLCWLIALALPAAIAALPVWTTLQATFAQSPHTAAIAAGHNLPLAIDGLFAMADGHVGLASGSVAAIALTLLLSPWLTGMVVASIRAGRRLRIGELAHGGLAEYGRMLRMLLWSVVPLGIALALGGALSGALDKHTAGAIFAVDAARATDIALAVLIVLAVFAHITLEAGRGWFAADVAATSVLRAWGKGVTLVLRRPLAALLVYLGSAVICYGLALLVAWLRLRTGTASGGGFAFGLLLTQVSVVLIAWARIARIYGYAALARDAIAIRPVRASIAAAPTVAAGQPMPLSPATSTAL